jgi:hypothetical protein
MEEMSIFGNSARKPKSKGIDPKIVLWGLLIIPLWIIAVDHIWTRMDAQNAKAAIREVIGGVKAGAGKVERRGR